MNILKKIWTLSREEKVNYFIVFLLLGVSGMPYFFSSIYNSLLLCVFTMFVFMTRKLSFDSRSMGIMGVFFLTEILQAMFIYSISPITFMGTVLRFLLSYLAIAVTGEKFTRYYINILYILTFISFFFFIPSAIIPRIYDFFVDRVCPLVPSLTAGSDDSFYIVQPTLIIFTFHPVVEEFRNPGPFWEPGANAIFINIALIFNMLRTGQLMNKKNIVFIIGTLSTLSTTGFVSMFIIIASFFLFKGALSKKIFLLLLFFPVAIYAFLTLDFLGAKITRNMELKDDTTSRFGSAFADIEDFSTSPLIGWGKGEMRFGGKEFTFFTVDQHRNNGLTNLLATYGIFAFLTLVYNYYKSYKSLSLYYSFSAGFGLLCFLVTIMMGFGEPIFQYPFFFSMMFLHLIYDKKKQVAVRSE